MSQKSETTSRESKLKSILNLKNELIKKLDSFEVILSNQPLYLTEFVGEIRNEIDIHTETLLIYLNNRLKRVNENDSTSQESIRAKIESLNDKRTVLLDELKLVQTHLMMSQASSRLMSQNETNRFEARAKELRAKVVGEHEKKLVDDDLAGDIVFQLRMTYQPIEKDIKSLYDDFNRRLFDGKKIFFIDSFFDSLGTLFILNDADFGMDYDEIEKMRCKYSITFK